MSDVGLFNHRVHKENSFNFMDTKGKFIKFEVMFFVGFIKKHANGEIFKDTYHKSEISINCSKRV